MEVLDGFRPRRLFSEHFGKFSKHGLPQGRVKGTVCYFRSPHSLPLSLSLLNQLWSCGAPQNLHQPSDPVTGSAENIQAWPRQEQRVFVRAGHGVHYYLPIWVEKTSVY